MEDRSELLASLLLAGITHLGAGRPEEAVAALRPLVEDPEFTAADELDDVKARAYSLFAQALVGAGRPADAVRWSEAALRLARALGDEAGVAEIRGLHAEIREAITTTAQTRAAREQAERLSRLSVAQVTMGLATPLERSDALIKKANADLDAGHLVSAQEAARAALAEAVAGEGVREEVFARIAISRAVPAEARVELTAAWRRAERASEFNLVGAVARAAEVGGVRLPTLLGPSGGEA